MKTFTVYTRNIARDTYPLDPIRVEARGRGAAVRQAIETFATIGHPIAAYPKTRRGESYEGFLYGWMPVEVFAVRNTE